MKGLIVGVPAVLTLASRSSLATVVCKPPSGFISGNASQGPGAGDCGSALSPGYWKTHLRWPSPYSPDAHFYGTSFGGLQFANTGLYQPEDITMIEVMRLGGDEDPAMLGFHVIGALLNIRMGYIPEFVLTESRVFDMFNQCALQGFYQLPSNPDIQWYPADIVTYLVNNHIAP